jgi:hypothetical protein
LSFPLFFPLFLFFLVLPLSLSFCLICAPFFVLFLHNLNKRRKEKKKEEKGTVGKGAVAVSGGDGKKKRADVSLFCLLFSLSLAGLRS